VSCFFGYPDFCGNYARAREAQALRAFSQIAVFQSLPLDASGNVRFPGGKAAWSVADMRDDYADDFTTILPTELPFRAMEAAKLLSHSRVSDETLGKGADTANDERRVSLRIGGP
jgi:hypothetical protein